MVLPNAMRSPALLLVLLFLLGVARLGAATPATESASAPVEAICVAIADQHSAYERTAQFVGLVDELKTQNPGVPLVVLIDGDTFELGNDVARRSGGAIEFAMFAALVKRAPTVLNVGNHEPEFYDLATTIAKISATGVTVIGGNLVDRGSGRPFAPAVAQVPVGAHTLTIVGVTTDHLATFRVAVRPSLDLADPVVWAQKNLPALLHDAELPVVMSHAGLNADRGILPLVPDGTLFVGAHDHLRLVQHADRTVYFHSGAWNAFASVARLRREPAGLRWEVEQVRVDQAPADPKLAALVRETMAHWLTPADRAVLGRLARALTPGEAARFAVGAVRTAAGADVAIVGATTFGGGLPAGDVTRYALDGCVRFDGTICVGEIEGARLKEILARCNQGPDTPFAERRGENLVAVAPSGIVPGRTYRIATTDWLAKNVTMYFGPGEIALHPRPELKLKAVVAAALER